MWRGYLVYKRKYMLRINNGSLTNHPKFGHGSVRSVFKYKTALAVWQLSIWSFIFGSLSEIICYFLGFFILVESDGPGWVWSRIQSLHLESSLCPRGKRASLCGCPYPCTLHPQHWALSTAQTARPWELHPHYIWDAFRLWNLDQKKTVSEKQFQLVTGMVK